MGLEAGKALKNIKALNENALILDDDQIHSLQMCLLSMLDDIIGVCETYSLRYTLSGGTCLGAVRHRGFIPWDDDADLNMPHVDCYRLVELLRRDYSAVYDVLTPRDTPGYGLPFVQVRKKGTVALKQEDVDTTHCGVAVDIFLVENVYDEPLRRQLHGFRCMAYGLALSCRRTYEFRDQFLKLAEHDEDLQRIFRRKIRLGKFFGFKSMDEWARCADKVYSSCKDDGSLDVTIPGGRNHYFGEMLIRQMMFPPSECKFEGRIWCNPGDPDAYLSKLHGDYMTVPDENNREHHIYVSFTLGE